MTLGDETYDVVQATFSPDGKRLAYVSNETGAYEVLVIEMGRPV